MYYAVSYCVFGVFRCVPSGAEEAEIYDDATALCKSHAQFLPSSGITNETFELITMMYNSSTGAARAASRALSSENTAAGPNNALLSVAIDKIRKNVEEFI